MKAKTFDILWDSLKKKADSEIGNNSDLFMFRDDCKNELFDEYILLRDEFKHRYMANSEMLIDRHKVAALFMISLLSVRPLTYLQPHEIFSNQADWLLNEDLAISMGLSILREFLIKKEPNNPIIKEKLENGFEFPLVNHGNNYKENWALELYWGAKRNNLFTLSLANELYLIEYHTTGYLKHSDANL